MDSDIVSRDSAGFNSLCTGLVHLEAGDLLVLGETPPPSTGQDGDKVSVMEVAREMDSDILSIDSAGFNSLCTLAHLEAGDLLVLGGIWSLWWWLIDGFRFSLWVDS